MDSRAQRASGCRRHRGARSLACLTALIDTSVLVGALTPQLDEPWVVSAVSVGELEAGVLLGGDTAVRARRLRRLVAVVAETVIVPVERGVAACYGELRAATGRQPANDLWIAATALANDFTLITADDRLASLPLIRAVLVS
jgi:predicted nucleic acid-binding protein